MLGFLTAGKADFGSFANANNMPLSLALASVPVPVRERPRALRLLERLTREDTESVSDMRDTRALARDEGRAVPGCARRLFAFDDDDGAGANADMSSDVGRPKLNTSSDDDGSLEHAAPASSLAPPPLGSNIDVIVCCFLRGV